MKALRICTLALAMVSLASAGMAETSSRKPDKKQKSGMGQRQAASADRSIYGYDYMTGHDRDMYHARMREAKTGQERAQFLAEHSQRMQERAKVYGVTLPDPSIGGRNGARR
jgi:hypothetical protein